MRWKLDLPNDGDVRTVVRFAFFPKTLNDKYRVWMEKYYVRQKYFVFTSASDEWMDRETWSHATEKKRLLAKLK